MRFMRADRLLSCVLLILLLSSSMPSSFIEGYAEETSPSNRISNELNIRTGDNLHSLKSVLKDIEFEMSERGGSHQVSIVRIPDNGVSVKLLRGLVYLVECKSPFAGFVNGLSIGDTKESVRHKMKRYLPFEQETSVKWIIKLALHENGNHLWERREGKIHNPL